MGAGDLVRALPDDRGLDIILGLFIGLEKGLGGVGGRKERGLDTTLGLFKGLEEGLGVVPVCGWLVENKRGLDGILGLFKGLDGELKPVMINFFTGL